jgi:predicted PurR-regulated permease PerM
MNEMYDPVVLGGAARLHPLVVFIGVVGDGMRFGLRNSCH